MSAMRDIRKVRRDYNGLLRLVNDTMEKISSGEFVIADKRQIMDDLIGQVRELDIVGDELLDLALKNHDFEQFDSIESATAERNHRLQKMYDEVYSDSGCGRSDSSHDSIQRPRGSNVPRHVVESMPPPRLDQSAVPTQPASPRSDQSAIRRQPASIDGASQTATRSRPDYRLERLAVPEFSGNVLDFEEYWAMFLALVDEGEEPDSMKMARLKKSLKGSAADCVTGLGLSSAEYAAAKQILVDRYGGSLREAQNYILRLSKWQPISERDPKGFDKLYQFTRATVAKLQAKGRLGELGPGALCNMILGKLPHRLRLNYHRWVRERLYDVSTLSLCEWMGMEVRVEIEAIETSPVAPVAATSGGNFRYPNYRNKNQTENRNFVCHEKLTDGSGSDSGGESDVRDGSRQSVAFFTRSNKCKLCDQNDHWRIPECREFLQSSVKRRWRICTNKGLCYRCLGSSHHGKDCRKNLVCGQSGCDENHHFLLHEAQTGTKVADSDDDDRVEDAKKSSGTNSGIRTGLCDFETEGISLRTVPVWVAANGRKLAINAVLDDGSNESFLTEEVAGYLGINRAVEKITVHTLNDTVETFESGPAEITILSIDQRVSKKVRIRTCPKRVTGSYKAVNWTNLKSRYPQMSDCAFDPPVQPYFIDLLIGTDAAELHASIRDVCGEPGEPVARLGPLGWSCIGPIASVTDKATTRVHLTAVTVMTTCCDLDQTLKQTWELEQVGSGSQKPMTEENRKALDIVTNSLVHDGERYQVSVPWKSDPSTLPDNRQTAERRLRSVERKLEKDPSLAAEYGNILKQYAQRGYLREVPDHEPSPKGIWYLPHFPVVRRDKSTTKVRIVLDAAARHDGVCLNDKILAGPKLQTDLFDVLLRFRRYRVALVSDITQMYLQVRIDPADRPYFRILWLDKVYEFERVCFGKNSAPMEAIFVARHNAEQFATECPLAADAILNCTYMDDTLYSTPTEDTAVEAHKQLLKVWNHAGMKAQKWGTNSAAVLSEIQPELRAEHTVLHDKQGPIQKALGVTWSVTSDVFSIVTQKIEHPAKLTKREVLKVVAAIFDPLGFVVPYTIRAKILLQEIWQRGYDWDTLLDQELSAAFAEWFSDLASVGPVEVSRCIQPDESCPLTLIAFADASKLAYSAVIYARSEQHDGTVLVRLVAAKAKVAPLASLSVPKLELAAALLACRLAENVCSVLQIRMSEVRFFSDSMDVLWWVRGRGRNFRPFVESRICEIQSLTEPQSWQFVPTDENPADLATRGITGSELHESTLWWLGPSWLQSPCSEWSRMPTEPPPKVLQEQRKTTLSVNSDATTEFLVERYSKLTRLCRVTGWVLRFVANVRKRPADRDHAGNLSVAEIREAREYFIVQAQRKEYALEYKALIKGSEVSPDSKLAKWSPWIDDQGLIRGRGRLENAEFLAYSVKYPILLPAEARITYLIVADIHEAGDHRLGVNRTLSAVTVNYWLPAARQYIKVFERKCPMCQRIRRKPAIQQMAPLRENRLQVNLRPFTHTSVDFLGPIMTKQGRGKVRAKRWVCLFCCTTTRAIHLELAYGLDTDSFLRTVLRFVARRGTPTKIFSDNGTNFQGVVRELNMTVLSQNRAVRDVEWEFNPPAAPHFGGIHEILVKAVKRSLPCVTDALNDEELTTVLSGVESDLNGRPLTYQTDDPRDEVPLTPNHFLVGQCGGKFVPHVSPDEGYDWKKRWRLVQQYITHVWRRFVGEVLPQLNPRSKWTEITKNLKVGDVVVVMDKSTPRGTWPLGRILKIFPGKDGLVRVAQVQVGRTTLVRPIVKLIPVEI